MVASLGKAVRITPGVVMLGDVGTTEFVVLRALIY